MNFKIENNFLNITNYPSIEGHFEDMARQGWLIHKILMGSLFIYKKIEGENLDFSIVPYEIETAFTRKTKEEREEFTSVAKKVGWNFATKSFNLHIYFKKAGEDAEDMQTHDEEDFRTLNFIGKRQLKSLYIQTPILLFFSWVILGGLFSNIYIMKDFLSQIIAPIIPFAIVLTLSNIFHLRKFLKTNKNNMETGREIQFSNSKFIIEKLTFPLFFIILTIGLMYIIYSAIFLRNSILLIGFIPLIIGGLIGLLYRLFVKPSKNTLTFKKVAFITTIVIGAFVSILIYKVDIFSIENLVGRRENPDIYGLKVLSANDFGDEKREEYGDLIKKASVLIPKSYEYTSHKMDDRYIRTEYAKALNEDLAKNLVNIYIRQGENRIVGNTSREIESSFKDRTYDTTLEEYGLDEKDFINLQSQDLQVAINEAEKIVEKKSIREDEENLWDLDQVYFLKYTNDEIVIRDGKEVFYLEGKDFSDEKTIKKVKDKLNL